MNYNLTDPYEIARFIKDSKKTTPVKVYVNGDLSEASLENIEYYGSGNFYILFGETDAITEIILLVNLFNVYKIHIKMRIP